MEPTRAPWATQGPGPLLPSVKAANEPEAETSTRPSRPGLTGRPVEAIIKAEPEMPVSASPRSKGSYQMPEKRILSDMDLKRFLKSDTLRSFVSFILAANDAVKGKKLSDQSEVSAAVSALVDMLSTLSSWVDAIPPSSQSLRYGNPAYRTWFDKLAEAAPQLLQSILPADLHPAIVELAPYLVDSFGNRTRIDYGTGHETTFVALLYCLARLGLLQTMDLQAMVTRVFAAYLQLMRKVQTTYWLEPAGSHGVWGLDDYQFLPFIWGSAQLIGHPSIRPTSIHAPRVLEDGASEYLYLASVLFTKEIKKGPLSETSPMINDISSVHAWEKVNSGTIKMYQVEVLSKFPIMQHFLFGSLLPFVD